MNCSETEVYAIRSGQFNFFFEIICFIHEYYDAGRSWENEWSSEVIVPNNEFYWKFTSNSKNTGFAI